MAPMSPSQTAGSRHSGICEGTGTFFCSKVFDAVILVLQLEVSEANRVVRRASSSLQSVCITYDYPSI
jgi:hypothetical protein